MSLSIQMPVAIDRFEREKAVKALMQPAGDKSCSCMGHERNKRPGEDSGKYPGNKKPFVDGSPAGVYGTCRSTSYQEG
jgi:hypothetical protein